ncbi:hypothetical protein BH10PLA1_BH10PLA1_13230 [soil metagenome]
MASETSQVIVDQPLPLAMPTRRAISLRSVSIGTLLVGLVCGVTPYNDYVVANTMMVGVYVPPILVILFFVLVVLINGLLHRYVPSRALVTGELGVIMAMTLTACGIPGQGMMRSLIPTLVSPFHHGLSDAAFWKNFTGMNLPGWLYPVKNIADGRSSDVMQWFYSHLPRGASAPYAAWVIPLAGWGVFMLAMVATFLALAAILTPQWAVNERLAFPIAQLQQAVIEAPPRGRALNDLFRSRLFWIAVTGVVICHSMVTLRQYFPRYVPLIPLRYDLRNVFTEEPWIFFSENVKAARIFFLFIGISYFISARVGFSLWSMYLFTELVNVQQRMWHTEIAGPAWNDQHLGASVALMAGVLWIARHHLVKVVRQAFSRRPDPQWPRYRVEVFTAILGPSIMTGWLLVAGVHLWVSVVIVTFVLMAHVLVARIVAETGLPFIRIISTPLQLITALPTSLFRANDVYFASVFQLNGVHLTRESLLAFSMHGLRVNESIQSPQKSQRGLLALMAWAAVFGFVVASASSLYCYYHYSLPLAESNDSNLNQVALQIWPREVVANPLNQFSEGRFAPKPHNPWLHMSIGVVVTGLLQAATLRWAWWPFLPVAYLVCSTWYIRVAWVSIFLGWLAKTIIVQYGGAKLYQQAKPFFFGLIFGEALAAGLWALINLSMALGGANYKVVQLLPY